LGSRLVNNSFRKMPRSKQTPKKAQPGTTLYSHRKTDAPHNRAQLARAREDLAGQIRIRDMILADAAGAVSRSKVSKRTRTETPYTSRQVNYHRGAKKYLKDGVQTLNENRGINALRQEVNERHLLDRGYNGPRPRQRSGLPNVGRGMAGVRRG
jgi:hypothetical protein